MPIPTRLQLLRELYNSRIGNSIKGLVAILVFGTAGFYTLGQLHVAGVLQPKLAAGWSLLDCIYFTTITLTTVGYGETLTPEGSLAAFPDVRIYTIGLLLLGMVATAYLLSSATAFFVEGDLKSVLERRRMLQNIAALRGHYIVCGAGQTGRHVAEEVAQSGKDCVVIDGDPKNIAILHGQAKVHSIVGDATKDETLIEAGIAHATGLSACLSDDKDNLFLVITARQLNPRLRIISKAIDMPTRNKLLKAGADGVVAPTFIGGLRMASELVRPAVVNFLDMMLRNKEAPVRFAEVRVGPALAGQTLGASDLARRAGLPVLAVKHPNRDGFEYNPQPETVLMDGTVLVVMGDVSRVTKLETLVGDRSHSGRVAFGLTRPGAGGTGEVSARAAQELAEPRREAAPAPPVPAPVVPTRALDAAAVLEKLSAGAPPAPSQAPEKKVLVEELKDPRDPI